MHTAKKHNSFLRYFPTPNFLKMPTVGFEITPESVRFLELHETAKGYKVGKFGERRIEAGVTEEDFLENEAVRKAVIEFRDKYKLGLISAVFPEEKTYIFRTELPRMNDDEIRDSLELKLEEHVPIPPREAVFDFQIVEPQGKDAIAVSVSVAPHLVVARYLEFFKSVGLVPTSFQVGAQAIANAVVKCGDKSPAIIVNFNEHKTGLYIVADRIVHFTSTVSVGGSSLTEAIKKSLSVSEAEAEKIKIEKGISKEKKDTELFFALVNTLSALKDEVEKLGSYWDTHLEQESGVKRRIEKVILCGKESALHGLAEYLETTLVLPVEVANVWQNAFSFEHYLPPLPRKESLSYASVIGLSLNHSC